MTEWLAKTCPSPYLRNPEVAGETMTSHLNRWGAGWIALCDMCIWCPSGIARASTHGIADPRSLSMKRRTPATDPGSISPPRTSAQSGPQRRASPLRM